MRALMLTLTIAAALAGSLAPTGRAADECRGIQACISVPGPWVVVPPHGTADYLLSCPRGVVGGLDAQATSRDVRVSFDGRLGAPVQPGQTTTRSAFFRAVSISSRTQLFQPFVGCIPTAGGGGRSTVSARVTPAGPSLEYRAHVIVVGPGDVKFARIACLPSERLAGGWDAVAFRTKHPPDLAQVGIVRARHVIVGKRVVLTASSTDTLSPDAHAIVQGGVECAP